MILEIGSLSALPFLLVVVRDEWEEHHGLSCSHQSVVIQQPAQAITAILQAFLGLILSG